MTADKLKAGDVLTLADGTTCAIDKVYAEFSDKAITVYNFEVADFHSYYVTDIGVLVHNAAYNQNIYDFIPDQIEISNGTKISKSYDRLVYGGYYGRKAYNRMRYEAKPENYTKHIKAHNRSQAETLSHKEAQYLPGIDHNDLEYKALFLGIPHLHSNSTMYYFYNTGKVIGYDRGMPTTWIRAELTSGKGYHGHPIGIDRLIKYR